jgi:hypothetical protein
LGRGILLVHLQAVIRVREIQQNSDPGNPWRALLEKFDALDDLNRIHRRHTGDVLAWSCQASHEAITNRVTSGDEDNGRRGRRPLSRPRGRCAVSDQDIDLESHQFGRGVRQPLV